MCINNLHNRRMTNLLEYAIERVRSLPREKQDDFARVLLQLTGEEQPVYEMTPEEEASLDEARAEVVRREFATDEQMRAIWAKHSL